MVEDLPVICKIEAVRYFVQVTEEIGYDEPAPDVLLPGILNGDRYGGRGTINTCHFKPVGCQV